MRIAVYGTGGVGGYFGGRLAQVADDVVFIARGPHLAAIQATGLHVESVAGDFTIAPAHATDDPKTVGVCDVVLVAVKGFQLHEILSGLRFLVGPKTVIVPLLNGVEASSKLGQHFGSAVVWGTCKILSAVIGPGHIRHSAVVPEVRVGVPGGRLSIGMQVDTLLELCAMFVRAHVDAKCVDDIECLLWEKLVFIAAYGGIGALTRAPIGLIRSDPGTRQLLQTALHEGIAVAKARGIAVKDDLFLQTMKYLDALPSAATTSLQRDIMAGRPSELDDWNGALVRLADTVGVDVPLHRMIVDVLSVQERAARS